MEIDMYLTVSNDWIVNDTAEDAPLAHIKFTNELRRLDIEEQLHLMQDIKLAIVEHLRKKYDRK